MLKNYFKIAWRSLLKDRQFTFLNVFGLSAGLACTLLIFLWVSDELSYDKFFTNEEQMYRLLERRNFNGELFYADESSGRLSKVVKQSLPEVEYAAAIAPAKWFPQNTISVNNKNIKANGQYVEQDYFNIFSFELLEGNRNSLLTNKNSIVLSDELATKLFGNIENIIGKPLKLDHDASFFVSGIFKKMPHNSSEQFDFVLSFDYFRTAKDWVNDWSSAGPRNFVLLKKGTDITTFNKKLENIITKNTGDTTRQVVATKFSDGYLYNHYDNDTQVGERIEYVKLFTALAIFILVIACINFMNLSTAKATRRLKEVGVKKVVGARRGQLIFQFLTESLLLAAFAMLIAIGLAAILLPEFNQLTGKSIALHINWQMIAGIVIIAIITGLLAGSYPALYISGFNPLAILKGKLNTSTAELLSRKGLVVFQFVLSTILIVGVTVIYQQMQFIQNANLGYNKENVVRFTSEGRIQQNQETFLSELGQLPGVVNAAYTFHNIIGRKYSDVLQWAGKDPQKDVYFEVFGVSNNFTETMNIQLKAGRSFSKDFGMDSLNIIVNETAVKVMNLKNPIGATVAFHGANRQIIGVVSDFHFESMHEPIKPLFMHLQKEEGSIITRIRQDNQKQTLTAIENLYKKYNPEFPFTYNFLDEAYQKQYETETRTATLCGYFSGLAILISCLGLFGLAAFTAQKRRKEIGIRKVVGASVAGVTGMLSKDFMKLIGIALLIAFPFSWWLMNNWLQNFVYRISITPAVFFKSGTLVLAIALVAIAFQTIKAAMANPVKALRTE